MEIFNIGTGELLALLLFGLILFGPEDLVKFARTAGRYAQNLQRAWHRLTAETATLKDLLQTDDVPQNTENQEPANGSPKTHAT